MRGFTISCDVCNSETSSMKDGYHLPDGWAIIGSTVQMPNDGPFGLQLDVGPSCLASSFPALITTKINEQVADLNASVVSSPPQTPQVNA